MKTDEEVALAFEDACALFNEAMWAARERKLVVRARLTGEEPGKVHEAALYGLSAAVFRFIAADSRQGGPAIAKADIGQKRRPK